MRDPYAILGVRASASQDEIKAAWRAAAKKIHPDQNPDDPSAVQRFTEIGRAYDVLKDPDKRRRYDRARAAQDARKRDQTYMERRMREEEAARKEAERRAEAAAAGQAQQAEETDDADDLFSRIFGAPGETARKDQAHAADERSDPFARGSAGSDAPRGASRDPGRDGPEPPKASAQASAQASNSGKTGQASAETAERLADDDRPTMPNAGEPLGAQAAGTARELIAYLLKRLTFSAPPPEKAPDMAVDLDLSIEALFAGGETTLDLGGGRSMAVTLAPGSKEGSAIRVEGQGHKLPGMRRGDLVATIRLKPHPFFRAEGLNLVTFQPVDIENAVLGCKTMVETLTGPVEIEVPEWSGSDQVVVIEGQGLIREDGSRGDLIVEIRVMLWDLPDSKVIDLMRSLREGLFL